MRLRVVHVAARFGERRLFDDLSFDAHTGEVVAVVGPSGSGKSTLLAIASGLIRPEAGEVLVEDDEGAPVEQLAHQCAWVPQGAAHLGARSSIDNVMLGGLGNGLSRSEARTLATEALERVGLTDRGDVRAALLSGGELQRLAIARALCLDRPLLFADEPTGSLDVTNTSHVFELLRRAADEGSAVVVATHDRTVDVLCDRLVDL